jgi:nucleoside-diphosphate kinase
VERTLVLVKHDGVQRGLIGEIIARFERRGLRIAGMKLMQITPELAAKHYQEHKGKDFYPDLVQFITSGPVVAMVLEGKDAIRAARTTMGGVDSATHPLKAPPGSIRGDFGMVISHNLVHGSDGADTATREIALFFQPDELLSYERAIDAWVYEDSAG